MPKQFEGKTCVLCRRRPSSPTGEHVWPRWLLKMFPPGEKQYTWWISGEQVSKRDGQPRTHTSVGAVKLPMCVTCNNKALEPRFEKPAKPLIRLLMDRDGNARFGGNDARFVALWFLKTWLLLAHPAARESDPDVTPARWDSVGDDLYSWLVINQPPPVGFSIWVTKRAEGLPDPAVTRRIPLPTVVADGREIQFRVKRAGVQFLDVSLVYHPGWEIEHPLEAEGRALRLWPRQADAGADFSSVPAVHPNDTAWLKGPRLHFLPDAFGSDDLPPLSPSFDPMDLVPRFISRGEW
jgi:hypothetical protein